jgi:hypothetical protein
MNFLEQLSWVDWIAVWVVACAIILWFNWAISGINGREESFLQKNFDEQNRCKCVECQRKYQDSEQTEIYEEKK